MLPCFSSCLTSHAGLSSCPFGSLPTEIHLMIFSHLTSYSDVFCLSLTTLYLWRLGRRRLKQFFTSTLSRLANKAIICNGSHSTTEYSDYPANLLTADEEAELEAGLALNEVEGSESGVPQSLYDLAEIRYCKIELLSRQNFPSSTQLILDPHIQSSKEKTTDRKKTIFSLELAELESQGFPPYERSQVLSLAHPDYERFYPKEREWVLRNLTAREFVRADAIAIKKEHVQGPEIQGLGFGSIVIARICWSSSPRTGILHGYKGGVHRGVWAGHRFDITTVEKLEEDGKEQWKDVSEEVMKEVEVIWKCWFGEEWAKKVCEEIKSQESFTDRMKM